MDRSRATETPRRRTLPFRSLPPFPSRRFLGQLFLLGAVASAFRIGLVLDEAAARFTSLVLFALAFVTFEKRWRPAAGVGGSLALLLALGVATVRTGPEGTAALVIGLTAAITLFLRPGPQGPCLLGGVVMFAGFVLGARGIDSLWRFEQTLAGGIALVTTELTGLPLRWGASATGVDLLLLGASFLIAQAVIFRPPQRRVLLALCLLLCVPVLVVVTGSLWYAQSSYPHGTPDGAQVFAWQLLFLPLVALALLPASSPGGSADADEASVPTVPVPARAILSGLLLFASVPLLSLAPAPKVPESARGTVLIHSRTPGLSDFRSPTWEQVGFGNTGLYGELVRWLRATGRDVRIADGSLDEGALEGVSTLVLLVPTGEFSPAERTRIHEFVRKGGALLLLADHTDIFGTARVANPILAPYGIQVRFDTAMETARAFTGNLEVRSTGVFDGTVDPKYMQILHGASLRLSGVARSLVVGRTMFGDFGNRNNGGSGAFLGDYRMWPAYEQIGDLVVGATAEAGAGRVAVFGDTSSFQNVAFARSANFVLDLFDWLEGGGSGRGPWLARIALLLAASLPAAWLAGRWIPQLAWGVAASLGGAILVLGPGPLAADNARAAAELPEGRKVFLVHSAGLESWATDHFADRSIEGLVTCAARDHLFPLVGDAAALDDLSRCATIVVPAATRMDPRTAQRLHAFAEQGGTLVVASGYEERQGTEALLAGFGFRLLDVPLSSAPILPYDQQAGYQGAQFAEAWPVAAREGPLDPDQVRFDSDGLPIVVERQEGAGRLVVIGDSWYLCDKYLEGEQAAHPGNLAFVRGLFFAPHEPTDGRDER